MTPPTPLDPSDETSNPQNIEEWTELHEAVDKLDEQQREVFELVWYHELGHDEIASLLDVTPRTVRRRWLEVRLQLSQLLGGDEL